MKTRVIWTKNEVFGHVPKLPLLTTTINYYKKYHTILSNIIISKSLRGYKFITIYICIRCKKKIEIQRK